MIFQTVFSILVFSFDYLPFCTLTSCSQVPVVPAIGAHRLSIGPLVLAICLTLTHCRSVICPPLPLCLDLLHHLLCLCKKKERIRQRKTKNEKDIWKFLSLDRNVNRQQTPNWNRNRSRTQKPISNFAHAGLISGLSGLPGSPHLPLPLHPCLVSS